MAPRAVAIVNIVASEDTFKYTKRAAAHLARRSGGFGGTVSPSAFSKGIIAIFSLLGAGLGILAWWFFIKRGGFEWREDDWDDYKSSVLRRKDANGKTISSGSTRAPGTVVSDLTFTEYHDDETRTEKMSEFAGKKRKGSKKDKGKSRFTKWIKDRKVSGSSLGRHQDQDLESYAEEEPARMSSYNPYPVHAPSVVSEDDSRAGSGVGRYPSRYAYAYSRSDEAAESTVITEKSTPLGPRKPSRKSSRKGSKKGSRRHHSASIRPPPTELATIPDDGESRLSFEMEDDAAFTVYSGAPPSKGTKAYPYPVPNPTTHYPSRQNSRKISRGTYASATTNSDSECDSDCSCCTTETESESDGEIVNREKGTRVYHHPLASLSPAPPPAVVVKKNSRGPSSKRSYRNDSVGTLSSIGSEGEGSVVETVTSKVKKALQIR